MLRLSDVGVEPCTPWPFAAAPRLCMLRFGAVCAGCGIFGIADLSQKPWLCRVRLVSVGPRSHRFIAILASCGPAGTSVVSDGLWQF